MKVIAMLIFCLKEWIFFSSYSSGRLGGIGTRWNNVIDFINSSFLNASIQIEYGQRNPRKPIPLSISMAHMEIGRSFGITTELTVSLKKIMLLWGVI